MVADHETTMAVGLAHEKQPRQRFLQLAEMLREEAADLADEVAPAPLKRLDRHPWINPYGISRARHGAVSNPFYRVATWILALRAVGAPADRPARIVEWVDGVVDDLWSGAPPSLDDVIDALLAESSLDAAEDVAEARALADEGELDVWLERAIEARDALTAAIRLAQRRRRHQRLAA